VKNDEPLHERRRGELKMMVRVNIPPVVVICVISLVAVIMNSKLYRYAGRPQVEDGLVLSVDADTGNLVVVVVDEGENVSRAFRVTEKCIVFKGNHEKRGRVRTDLDAIRSGDQVKVRYRETNGLNIASSIWIKPTQDPRRISFPSMN
jgi:hypothetical protein